MEGMEILFYFIFINKEGMKKLRFISSLEHIHGRNGDFILFYFYK